MKRLVNVTQGGREIAAAVEWADSFWRRGIGLLGRAGLPAGAALWIAPCPSIHMFGMRFALDLLFLDADLRVVKVVRQIRPWRMASGGPGTHSVVELATGWLPADAAKPGDQLAWEPGRTANSEAPSAPRFVGGSSSSRETGTADAGAGIPARKHFRRGQQG